MPNGIEDFGSARKIKSGLQRETRCWRCLFVGRLEMPRQFQNRTLTMSNFFKGEASRFPGRRFTGLRKFLFLSWILLGGGGVVELRDVLFLHKGLV